MRQNPEKNTIVFNWPPSEMTKSMMKMAVPNSGECSGGKFVTLPFFEVASPGLSHFRGWPDQESGKSGVARRISHPVCIHKSCCV